MTTEGLRDSVVVIVVVGTYGKIKGKVRYG